MKKQDLKPNELNSKLLNDVRILGHLKNIIDSYKLETRTGEKSFQNKEEINKKLVEVILLINQAIEILHDIIITKGSKMKW